jgi:nucleotide-binding universal stress UspA family protein
MSAQLPRSGSLGRPLRRAAGSVVAVRRLRAVSGVLVGFDDSAAARRALDRGIAEAKARSARLVVLSVFEVPLDPQVDRFFGTLDDIADWEGQPIAPPPELVGMLTQARDEVEAAGLEADFMWAAGEPGRAIVDAARDARADVVVLGEHHHGFLAGLFGTDVAATVERELGTAVIVA